MGKAAGAAWRSFTTAKKRLHTRGGAFNENYCAIKSCVMYTRTNELDQHLSISNRPQEI